MRFQFPEGKLPSPSLLVLIALREAESLDVPELEEAVGIPDWVELVPGTVTGEREEGFPEVAVLSDETKLLPVEAALVAVSGARLLELTGAPLVVRELRLLLVVGALLVVTGLRLVLFTAVLVGVAAGALAVAGGGALVLVAGGGVAFGGAALGAGAGLG